MRKLRLGYSILVALLSFLFIGCATAAVIVGALNDQGVLEYGDLASPKVNAVTGTTTVLEISGMPLASAAHIGAISSREESSSSLLVLVHMVLLWPTGTPGEEFRYTLRVSSSVRRVYFGEEHVLIWQQP